MLHIAGDQDGRQGCGVIGVITYYQRTVTEVQNTGYILNCYLAWHECMFRTNNTPAFHTIHTNIVGPEYILLV